MIARVLDWAEHLIGGKKRREAINALTNRNALIGIVALITKIKSVRVVSQDR